LNGEEEVSYSDYGSACSRK